LNDRQELYYNLVAERRSVRSFRADPIEPDVIARLLQAANQAPSAHNSQPWRFVVLQDPDVRFHLQQVMLEKFRDDLIRDDVPGRVIDRRIRHAASLFSGAPVAILLSLTMAGMQRYPDPERSQAEYDLAVQSVSLAAGQLLLAAQSEGLGSCWLCSPRFAPQTVRSLLELPADWQPQALLLLGYADRIPPERSRQPVEELVLWR